MDPNLVEERAHLIDAVTAVSEELERATGGEPTVEEIEGAKAMTAELIDRYDDLLNRLDPPARRELQQQIGRLIELRKRALTQLKEAPE